MTHSLPQAIKIGTRASPLARRQADMVREALMYSLGANSRYEYEIHAMTTKGDKIQDRALIELGGKGLFTAEIEQRLHQGELDIAVHSLKDMPTELPPGLCIGAVLPRANPCDVWIGEQDIAHLPYKAVVGTASLRRQSQILARRPDIKIIPLRGNVQTRLQKLSQGVVCATILAAAGLERLGMEIGSVLPITEMLPAVGQGIICIECREDDEKMREILRRINCQNTWFAAVAERAFLKILDGSCRTPIAGYAKVENGLLSLTGLLATFDGQKSWRKHIEGPCEHAETLGKALGAQLLPYRPLIERV